MLRRVLLALGALLLVSAIIAASFGYWRAFPYLLLQGLVLTAGIAWERWRYKPDADQADPHWTDTGERFTDPGSGALIGVYSDSEHGERHYVKLG